MLYLIYRTLYYILCFLFFETKLEVKTKTKTQKAQALAAENRQLAAAKDALTEEAARLQGHVKGA